MDTEECLLQPSLSDHHKSTVPILTYFPDRVTFTEAKTQCSDAGYTIALPSSEEKHNVLLEYLRNQSVDTWVWIGLVRENQGFVWLDGKPATFTAWSQGEPNNYGGAENCTELLQSGWNDKHCEESRAFVCETLPPTSEL